MASVLSDLRQRLNLVELVLARPLHVSFDRECPLLEIDFRVEYVVAVVRKLLKRHDFDIRKRRSEVLGTKCLAGRPVAETDSGGNQIVAHFRERKNAQCRDRSQFEQLPASLA